MPAGRQQPLSLRAQRARRPARRFRAHLRAGRRHRQILLRQFGRARQHRRADLDLAQRRQHQSRPVGDPPLVRPRVEEISGVERLAQGAVLVRGLGKQAPLAFRAARRFGHRSAFAGQSFWWTVGGEGFEALALAVVGMPAPTLFADILTGVFARTSADA